MAEGTSTSETTPIAVILRQRIHRGKEFLAKPRLHRDMLAMWISGIRTDLEKIYGKGAPQLAHFPQVPLNLLESSVHDELRRRIEQVQRIIENLEAVPRVSESPLGGNRIFIGHGRSPLWRELKDFLAERLGLPWDEFNREPVAGYPTSERLEAMLSQAAFAFLVMTAEEEHADSTVHARPNVIHEAGLFQGRLGFPKAIVLLEEGCSEFSNMTGLSQIRFPPGEIRARFEDCRHVLEREGLL
jgi:predicted nucleotide-binding protein